MKQELNKRKNVDESASKDSEIQYEAKRNRLSFNFWAKTDSEGSNSNDLIEIKNLRMGK